MGWCSAVSHVADIITPVLVGWMFGRKGGSDGYVWVCFGAAGELAVFLKETRRRGAVEKQGEEMD